MTADNRGRLKRPANERPEPVRLLHLGLSAFHRAHQAWYTHRLNAMTGAGWGISAFTGRRPDEALKLAAQDGVYTLVTRSSADDSFEVISSISEAHAAEDTTEWLAGFSRPDVVLITLTITEAGYCLDAAGSLDWSRPDVAEDIARLRNDPESAVVTAPAKIVQGLRVRRDTVGTGLAVVSCDNVTANGARTRAAVLELSAAVDAELRDWIAATVTFPGTMVDRITPRATDADRQVVLDRTGWADDAVVVAEPFSEWIIEDTFPAGRPEWDLVGARFVSDVGPYERRKLLLLNGGHSLLAYLGLVRGWTTVDQAVADPVCRAALEQWWGECAALVPFDASEVAAYCGALLVRWSNPRMQHQLAQIATDGSQKLTMRTVPVLRARVARGQSAPAAELVLAAWLANLRGLGGSIQDADPTVTELADGELEPAIDRLVERFMPELRETPDLVVALANAYEIVRADHSRDHQQPHSPKRQDEERS